MFVQAADESAGEGDGAVFVPFAFADDDLSSFEVDVFDAESTAFKEAHAGAVEQFEDESHGIAGHASEDVAHFVDGEDDGESFRLFGSDGIDEWELNAEDVAIEEEETGEGLVLSAGGDFSLNGEMREERLDFRRAHLERVAFLVEQDEAANPADVSGFRPF